MATRKSTQPAPESSAKDRADNTVWEKAGLKVRAQLADAIEILRKAAQASACETQAEKAVHDLGEMLGARLLPLVLAFLEAGPINNDRAAEGDARLIDAVQIMEALAGIAVGSPFESSMRAANELLMGALGALSDTAPWIGAPADAAEPRDGATENVNHDDMLKDGVFLSSNRRLACLEATWEIDAIADETPKQSQRSEDDAMAGYLLIRALCARLHDLTSVLVSGLDEPEKNVPTDQLFRKLREASYG